ncbi:ferritin family protein [candidate division WOR-3 bacterium]|nr:ferritin family protein [candidate division WOR-3 bacterium]
MRAEEHHSLEDLFGMAIKAEIEAQNIYTRIGEKTKNFVLKEKMGFLTSEEKKHETILRGMFKQKFSAEPEVPAETMVPVPAWNPDDGEGVSDILRAAMQTEMDAKAFYEAMAERIDEAKSRSILGYLAAMEQTHYHLLEAEYNTALEMEDYERFDPAVHWGA